MKIYKKIVFMGLVGLLALGAVGCSSANENVEVTEVVTYKIDSTLTSEQVYEGINEKVDLSGLEVLTPEKIEEVYGVSLGAAVSYKVVGYDEEKGVPQVGIFKVDDTTQGSELMRDIIQKAESKKIEGLFNCTLAQYFVIGVHEDSDQIIEAFKEIVIEE